MPEMNRIIVMTTPENKYIGKITGSGLDTIRLGNVYDTVRKHISSFNSISTKDAQWNYLTDESTPFQDEIQRIYDESDERDYRLIFDTIPLVESPEIKQLLMNSLPPKYRERFKTQGKLNRVSSANSNNPMTRLSDDVMENIKQYAGRRKRRRTKRKSRTYRRLR